VSNSGENPETVRIVTKGRSGKCEDRVFLWDKEENGILMPSSEDLNFVWQVASWVCRGKKETIKK
jgi:hypothetical protein